MKNYYKILELQNFSSHDEVKRAFKRLAVRFHPDKNPNNPSAEERFKEVNEAYQYLINPDFKQKYDILLYQNVDIDALYAAYLAQQRAQAQEAAQRKTNYEPINRRAYDTKDYVVGFYSVVFMFYLLYFFSSVNGFIASIKYFEGHKAWENKAYSEAISHLNTAKQYREEYAAAYFLSAQCWLAQDALVSAVSTSCNWRLQVSTLYLPCGLLVCSCN